MDAPKYNWQQDLSTNDEYATREDDETVWLLSYADLMTLLFTFFVMLYASVAIDDGKSLREALAVYVQKHAPGESTSSSETAPLTTMKSAILQNIENENDLQDVQLEMNANGLMVTFSSSLLFEVGQFDLRPEFRETLKKIVKTIIQSGPNYKIQVEGHTDDLPISNSRFKSNWELSAARAANIAAFIEQQGFESKNITAAGYSSSRPVAHNRTPAGAPSPIGQKLNRRVVINVIK